MRLGLVLCKWPKVRPNGNIWIGINQMVRKVEPWHKKKIAEDISRERKNIFLCMHPAVSVEQEAAFYDLIDKESESPTQTWYKLKKAYAENTKMAPVPIQPHYDYLKTKGQWQKLK